MFYVLSILMSLVGAAIIHTSVKKLLDEISSLERLRDLNIEIKSWIKVVAKVTNLEVNCDHSFPGLVPDSSDIEGVIEKERFEIEFNKKMLEVRERNLIYGGVNITYEYETKNGLMESRAIGLLPSSKDFSFLKKLSVGSKIIVFVNPKDMAESYIKKTGSEEIDKELNTSFMSFMPRVFCGLLLIIMALFSITMDMPPI